MKRLIVPSRYLLAGRSASNFTQVAETPGTTKPSRAAESVRRCPPGRCGRARRRARCPSGASFASIGGRAGVSRGLPAHHFGSKDALVTHWPSGPRPRSADDRRGPAEPAGGFGDLSACRGLPGRRRLSRAFRGPGARRAGASRSCGVRPSPRSARSTAWATPRGAAMKACPSGSLRPEDGSVRGRRPHGQCRGSPWSDAGGGRPFPLRHPPGGHARRPPDLSRMDCFGPGAPLRELPHSWEISSGLTGRGLPTLAATTERAVPETEFRPRRCHQSRRLARGPG